jgi:hypothetical protein
MNRRSSVQADLESPSSVSVTSTDIPHIELRPLIVNESDRFVRNDVDTRHTSSPMKSNETTTSPSSFIKPRSIPVTPVKQNPFSSNRIDSLPARLFVALYDYDPKAMSPNVDNDEELLFKEGQIIKVT